MNTPELKEDVTVIIDTKAPYESEKLFVTPVTGITRWWGFETSRGDDLKQTCCVMKSTGSDSKMVSNLTQTKGLGCFFHHLKP